MHQHTVQTPYMVGEAHFYTTELPNGLALFDTGPPTAEGEAALLASVDLGRLKYLFITHCHVDHYGLTNFVLDNSGAEVFIARRDAIKFDRHAERMECIASLLDAYGFGEDFVAQLRETFDRNKVFPTRPQRYRIVEECAELSRMGITWLACPGHSQSDLVYVLNDCAVTGDVLLRNIFQAPLLDVNLDTFSGRFRNYDAYCRSVLELARLRGMRIMPGHRHHVECVDEAVLFYVTTMLERARQVLPLRNLPLPQIIDRLFQGRLIQPFFVYLKISEIVFMLDLLENPDLLKRSLEETGLFNVIGEQYAAVTQC